MAAIDGETLIRNVGHRIGELRRARGITQEAFAARANIGFRYVQKVERGVVNLTLVTIAQWAKWLGVDPQDLLRPPKGKAPGRGRPTRR
ncbi:MAG: helix-turn-helix transcriptional regulator [Myxococcaceae bacterium]|nr:helix-turn-helix transcriptional regulator [Myxococcaceae bacterium]